MDLSPKNLRKHILKMAYHGQSVHIPSAFSIVEILSVLFDKILKPEDKFVLSKGHGVMALYAVYRELGQISEDELLNYFKDGTRLCGLAEQSSPGVYTAAGSLGHGFPVACGMALAKKRNNEPGMVYALCGDGEMNAGPIWEAVLFAAQHKLGNLVLIVDRNGYQALGRTEDILGLGNIEKRMSEFEWDAVGIPGHAVETLWLILKYASGGHTRPTCIVADTIKGNGLKWMEGKNEWHYTRLTKELYDQALKELQ